MANLTRFQADIFPLFTERDIRAMSEAFNLGSYDEVKTHAAVIYAGFAGSAGPSSRPRRREEKAPGLNPGLSSSPNGWPTGTNLKKGSWHVDWAGSEC
jgi:hypothetical protein